MSDAHGHDEHNGLPPPEPDPINGLNVFLWGAGTFVVLIITIALLGSYFWVERLKENTTKVDQAGKHQLAKKSMLNDQKTKLTTYHKLENGRVQVPIDAAMKLVVKDYAQAK